MRSPQTRLIAAVTVVVLVVVAAVVLGISRRTTDAPATPAASASASAHSSGSAGTSAAATAAASANACATPGTPPTGTVAANFATALAFAPDGRLFIAERGGRIRVASGAGVSTFATVATVTTEPGGGYSERGLLGLAISPTFATDRYVYAYFDRPNRATQDIVRFTDCHGVGQSARTIVTLPAGDDCCHKGGRIKFGPDGKLYATIGDEHSAGTAQNKSDLRGKILRYNPDGSVPGDNPFGNAVWAYGLRNPFGLGFAPDGTAWITSNGPSGDAGSPGTGYDMILSASKGTGFQWPYCYGYSHPIGSHGCAGLRGPAWSSENSTVVPTGVTYVDGSGPAAMRGHVVFCTYDAGGRILTGGSPGSVSGGPANCRLDIVEGPDHAVYFSDEGHVYRQA